MGAPSLVWKAAWNLFGSGEIYNDLYVSGSEFFWGYFLSVAVAIPFGIGMGWYKKMAYIFDPFVNAERHAVGRAIAADHHLVGYRHPFKVGIILRLQPD